MGSGCKNSCRKRCQENITFQERQHAHNEFWSLQDHARQWTCLSHLVTHNGPKLTKQKTGSRKKKYVKNVSHVFTLPTANKGRVQVCRTMFLSTLGISYKWIRSADKKSLESNTPGSYKDNRGRHKTRCFKVPESIKDTARKHIKMFPTIDSHYCRANSKRKYLEEGLSINKMYLLYRKLSLEQKRKQIVSKQMYSKIYNTEFNYGFHRPKKDRCAQCETYSNLSETEKAADIEKQNEHIRNKEEVRTLKTEDKMRSKNDLTYCTINFDLQKVLTTPRAQIGPLYYMSKLNVYNFTIFELGNCAGHCNVWNETIGQRGSNEIASILYQFIHYKKQQGVTDFSLYSDNCGGQNRNRNVFSMYMKAAWDLQVNITHRFLEPGHTECEGDTMHACIERISQRKDIFTEDQWCFYMKKAKIEDVTEKNSFNVNKITQNEILDYSELCKMFNWSSVKIASLKEIKVCAGSDSIFVKYKNFDTVSELKILKKKWRIENVRDYELKNAYTGRIALTLQKKTDFNVMMRKLYIPRIHHPFYNEILLN